MGYKTAYKDVMRVYEADRDRATLLAKERRDVIYKRIPRVAAIDVVLSETAIKAAKQVLNHAGNSEALLAEMKREIQALRDERASLLRENGIPEDYFANTYRCARCSDTGYLQNEYGETERCSCLKQRLIEKYYDLSNLKDILTVENFDMFDLRYYSEAVIESEGLSPHANMQTVYRTAMNFVTTFGKQFQNLLFYGEPGLGKTFLCHCVAKDLLDMGHTVLYVTAPALCKMVEDYRFNRDEMEEPDETIDAVNEVDLLILDDLGTEFATVVTSSALFNIINQRLLAKKATVISTNLSPSGFEAQYSERIISRFFGHYKMLKFFGDDIRVKKKYGVK